MGRSDDHLLDLGHLALALYEVLHLGGNLVGIHSKRKKERKTLKDAC